LPPFSPRSDPPRRPLWRVLAALALLLVLGVTALLARGALRERDEMRTALGQVRGTYDPQLASLATRVTGDAELIASLGDPDVRVVDLRPPGGKVSLAARGRAFWRSSTNGWTVFVEGLPPVRGDSLPYELRFVMSDGTRRSGGRFAPAPAGAPSLELAFSARGARLAALEVTRSDGATVLRGSVAP
jgi:hypothetical protein